MLWRILTAPFRGLLWIWQTFVVAPYYEVTGNLGAFFGRLFGGAMSRGPVGFLVDLVLFLPRLLLWLIGSLFQWIWWAVANWPRLMRLQDLGWGIPALLVAVVAVPALLFVNTDGNELFSDYQTRMTDAFEQASTTGKTDPEVQQEALKEALFYARCLAQLQPLNPAFRFSMGMLYTDLGDEERGAAIISDLAPRNAVGYGRAHVTRAHQILMERPVTQENFYAAIAHLENALKSTESELNRDAVHHELGGLYFQAYQILESGLGMVRGGPSKAALLEEARKHYEAYQGTDPLAILRLTHILAQQGKYETAKQRVQGVVAELKGKLDADYRDVQSRIELARVLASIGDLDQASDILELGRIRAPDRRLDKELSTVHFERAKEFQRRMPAASDLPFQALRAAFEADATNGYVLARLFQSFVAGDKEAELARKMLSELPPEFANAGSARFLLGFDAERRQLPQLASEHYAAARNSPDPNVPAVLADVAMAAIVRKYPGLTPAAGIQIADAGLRLWPKHPDFLFIRAQTHFQAHRYAQAISELNNAVAAKKNDVKLTILLAEDVNLHRMLGSAYAKLGQRANADAHLALARAAAARKEPLQ